MTPKPNTEANPAKTSSEKIHVAGGFCRISSLYFALYFPSDLKFSFPARHPDAKKQKRSCGGNLKTSKYVGILHKILTKDRNTAQKYRVKYRAKNP